MFGLKNYLNVFCARRRWLKRIVNPLLSSKAYLQLSNHGVRIYFNPRDLIGPSFHLAYDLEKGFQNYEEIDKEEIIKALPEEGVFIDVGANIGLFSLYILKKCPKVKVIAFEPNSQVRQCLEHTKKFNNLNIYPYAIAKENKKGILYRSTHNDGGHSINKEYEQVTQGEFENIEIRALSREFLASEKEKVDVIKIDVEGAEREVLEGALELIKQDRPMLIIEIKNRELVNNQGLYIFLAKELKDEIIVRIPGSPDEYNFNQISALAENNLNLGTEYNNYIFEFKKI
jgi:FkbM family methyltransferase